MIQGGSHRGRRTEIAIHQRFSAGVFFDFAGRNDQTGALHEAKPDRQAAAGAARICPGDGGFFIGASVAEALPPGHQAGSPCGGGYRVIVIDRVPYYAHRLAWLYVHGEHPAGEIDHINAVAADDRIASLRQCSRSENARNTRRRNPSGFKGVFASQSRRWRAQISLNGRSTHLGMYDTAQEAAAAYDAAARLHFENFARTNAGSSEIKYPAQVSRTG